MLRCIVRNSIGKLNFSQVIKYRVRDVVPNMIARLALSTQHEALEHVEVEGASVWYRIDEIEKALQPREYLQYICSGAGGNSALCHVECDCCVGRLTPWCEKKDFDVRAV
jgi:hypothetical protein